MNRVIGKSLGLILLAMSMLAFFSAQKDLPKVLLIGDSISIGYLPFVQDLLQGKVNVDRIPLKEDGKAENCQGTTNGVRELDRWLGDTKWEVIHFNFGLHDLKHINPESGENSDNPDHPLQADPEQYRKNLEEIVTILQGTGAKLIFATTTPYVDVLNAQIGSPHMYEKYNEVALRIMSENEIKINALHSFVQPQMDKLMRPNNVHFTEEGSRALGGQVAKAILDALSSN